MSAVGRAALLGLAEVAAVVLVDTHEHGWREGERLPEGTIVLEVWGGDWTDIMRALDDHAPHGVLVVPILRPARAWHRWRAWWRFQVDRFTGRWK